LAFCARLDPAKRKEKDFFSKPDPYIDAWMLLTGRVRKVFDVIKFVKSKFIQMLTILYSQPENI
jgi:hypothetical protein